MSFKSEPSAVGRVLAALLIIGGASIGTAITGFVAAVALIGRTMGDIRGVVCGGVDDPDRRQLNGRHRDGDRTLLEAQQPENLS